MKKNIVVGQSGGPTAVINASVAGVYSAARRAGIAKIYGMEHGIQGFLQEELLDLDEYLQDGMGVEILKRTPSAFLGTCRFKMPVIEGNEELYEKVFQIMEKYEIEAMFYIGGNDSMDTIKMLSDYAGETGKPQKFIGIPKTVDNDLPVTDHCPGYGSAAKYIATTVKEVICDNGSFGLDKPSVCVVEIMGRHAGWLTAAAALSVGEDCEGPGAIYLPEKVFDIGKFIADMKEVGETRRAAVIAVSEGIKLADGRFVCELGESAQQTDVFGHRQLSGCGAVLSGIIAKELGYKTRAIEFSTVQRSATHLASLTDIEEAFMAGSDAVRAAEEGKTGVMVTLVRDSKFPYHCKTGTYDIHEIANREKCVPEEWINERGTFVTQDFIDYARPLILGELMPYMVNGVPRHLVRKKS